MVCTDDPEEGLAIVAETFLKFLACEEYAALDSAEREIHVFGYFVVFIACNMHRERYAVFVGEFVDGLTYLVGSESIFGSVDSALLAQVEKIEIVGSINDCCGTAGTAVVVDEDIAHDGEDPSFEVGVLGVLLFVVESLQGSVLQEIVSIVAVRGEHECEIQQITS